MSRAVIRSCASHTILILYHYPIPYQPHGSAHTPSLATCQQPDRPACTPCTHSQQPAGGQLVDYNLMTTQPHISIRQLALLNSICSIVKGNNTPSFIQFPCHVLNPYPPLTQVRLSTIQIIKSHLTSRPMWQRQKGRETQQ